MGIVGIILFLDAFMFYCMLCVGAREDRLIEQWQIQDADNKKEKSEEIIHGIAEDI
jgi:hypothetical protein